MFSWVCANSVAVCAFLFVSNYLYINVVDIVFDLFCCFVVLDLLCCVVGLGWCCIPSWLLSLIWAGC